MPAAIFNGPHAIEVGERPDLDHVAEAYMAMDERRAIKSLILMAA